MSPPGSRQKPTLTKIAPRVSPDDVRFLEIQRDARLKADQRSDTEKYFGDPDYARSALADYRARQAKQETSS
jgi:hypothetical protein